MQFRPMFSGWQIVPVLFTGTLMVLVLGMLIRRKDVVIAAAILLAGAGAASWAMDLL